MKLIPEQVPIVMPSAVRAIAPFTRINQPEARLSLVLDGIEKWKSISPTSPIVICDGSGYDLTPEVHYRFGKKNIEVLCFTNNLTNVLNKGKGYGEGEILNFTINNSDTLKNADYFSKCTSKLWVSNYLDLLNHCNFDLTCDLIAKRRYLPWFTEPQCVDTRFYIVRKEFYINRLTNLHHNVNDEAGFFLEHCFLRGLQNSNKDICNYLIMRNPHILGHSGSSGEVYKLKKSVFPIAKRILRRFALSTIRQNDTSLYE